MLEKNILLVTENGELRNQLEEALSGDNISLLLASDAVEALRILSRKNVDAVISDDEISGIHGETLARIIRRNPRFYPCPVILLTNSAISEFDLDYSPAFAYLNKLCDINTVRYILEDALMFSGPLSCPGV